MKKIVFNVIYSLVEADDFQDPLIRVKTFDTEEKAEKWMAKDFKSTLSFLKKGGTVYDIVESENYGDNAYIELGELDEDDIDNSTIEAKHIWRVCKQTINNIK